LVGELEHQHLRVLIANERSDRLDYVAGVVAGLGHEVVARSVDVGEVGPMTGRELPDVALVGLGESGEHALQLIGEIVHQASCPVIALLETDDHAFVNEAAKRGVFAYITDTNPLQLQDSLDIVLRRFAEFQSLEGAFGRRAVIERAKGILMERHGTSEEQAFEMLHGQSRSANRKLVEIAAAVVEGHSLLPAQAKVTP
jgi:AmiR/NasT family two-component response regulator